MCRSKFVARIIAKSEAEHGPGISSVNNWLQFLSTDLFTTVPDLLMRTVLEAAQLPEGDLITTSDLATAKSSKSC